MAKAFLRLVAEHIHLHHKDKVENLCIVLPNKRAAVFLKRHIAEVFGATMWLPAMITAEELVTELSGLRIAGEIDLICALYGSYSHCYGADAEPFESFVKWGQLILQDYNEIDRYLADAGQLYENLKDIREIENWSLGEEQLSEYQTKYLAFMNSLGAIYRHFTDFLLARGLAYQGLAYRVAAGRMEDDSLLSQYGKVLFCGFNALNAAEIKIFQALLKRGKAEVLWDADVYYLNNKDQEAGSFLRKNLELFPQKELSFIGDHFSEPRNISIVSVPKQIGQAQVVRQEISRLHDQGITMDRAAVVLANEKLLWPVLQQLPESVTAVNITMEYPLKLSSSYSLATHLIGIHLAFSRQTGRKNPVIYHKEFISVMRHPLFTIYLKQIAPGLRVETVCALVAERNLGFITEKNLVQLFGEHYPAVADCFKPLPDGASVCNLLTGILENCLRALLDQKSNELHVLETEYLSALMSDFRRMAETIALYPQFNTHDAFRQLFLQVTGQSSVPFVGEPLSGLQIMGVLETRTLDFDNIIMVNVNEGVLPSGKTVNSFIPNDLKRAFGLPLYLEKDAVYAYHFYRLLQRAKNITIICDSETDTFGKGEKSRFVTQLQMELKKYNPATIIEERVAVSSSAPSGGSGPVSLAKDETLMRTILSKALSDEKYHGLSPSALISFKDCSLKFYYRYGVLLKETADVEETAEANTFGSILHLALEKLYTPFNGGSLTSAGLASQMTHIEEEVRNAFITFFENPPTGKSLLQEEVIRVYVRKLLQNDIKLAQDAEKNKLDFALHGLESEMSADLIVNISGKPQKIFVKGKIDRIDRHGRTLRVIDYKSSVKDTDKFVFESFDLLFRDKRYDKLLQLTIYAWLLFKNNVCSAEELRPCIVPFKVFNEEPRYVLDPSKNPMVFSKEFLNEFEEALSCFAGEIFDQDLPFTQTEDRKICEYCSYNVLCNFHP